MVKKVRRPADVSCRREPLKISPSTQQLHFFTGSELTAMASLVVSPMTASSDLSSRILLGLKVDCSARQATSIAVSRGPVGIVAAKKVQVTVRASSRHRTAGTEVNSFSASSFCKKHASRTPVCRVKAQDDVAPSSPPPEVVRKSILCSDCEGNGAVVCSQCKGEGLNPEDFFQGRFKAGQTCWLCRGKRQMLCGSCNGAGFQGGFMSTQDD